MSRHICRRTLSDIEVRLLADLAAVDIIANGTEGTPGKGGLSLKALSDVIERRLSAELRPPRVKRSRSPSPAPDDTAPDRDADGKPVGTFWGPDFDD